MMNWLKKWFFRWSFIDIPTLVVGLTLSFWYLKNNSSAGFDTVFIESIVPNLATELFGVWLSVRIIETVLRMRQKRSQLRSQLIDNMKYLITIVRGIAPHFEVQTIDHLKSELVWFEEMKDYRISGTSNETIDKINTVTKLYEKATAEALKINPLRNTINDLFLNYPEMLDDIHMKKLHDIYRRQNYTRISVERIDVNIEFYKDQLDQSVSAELFKMEQETIQKLEEYSETLKVYIAITLDAESAVLDARSSVLDREYNY